MPNGNASFDMSVDVTARRIVRAFGPISVSTDHAEVTSNTCALAPAGIDRRIQSKSCVAKPVPVTT